MKPPLNASRRDSTGQQAGATALGLILMCSPVGALAATPLTESDYLAEMPVVLSVSRLPQRLDETPGAMTIIDRDFIRQSGARDVVDVLRLVPGFQTSTSFESDAPQANYHGSFGVYSARIQVLIDGRSVYSNYLFGSVAPGLMSVALDDIERIEVFRGSNSAAYGARAMLGVVNIVTRSPAESLGARVGLNRGENGIADTQLSLGWQLAGAPMRFTADQRGDDGLIGSNGHNRVQRFNFRADVAMAPDTQLELRTGWMGIDAGRGFATNVNAPARDTGYQSSFLQFDWKKTVDSSQDYAFAFAHLQESFDDVAPYAPLPAVMLDYSGVARNDSFKFESVHRLTPDLRYVWGAEWRRESVTSAPLYNTHDDIVTDFTRLFTNIEWRLGKDLLVNAGGMAEHSSASGSTFAPRLMLNWKASPGQTLRGGVARAFRPPSVFEKQGDIRYSVGNQVLQVTTLARGKVEPESVLTRELGYLAELPWLNSQLDVRVYDEAISGFIQSSTYALPAGTSLFASTPRDYTNGDNFSVRGIEAQWQSQPWKGALLGLNYEKSRVVHGAPLYDPDLLAAVPTSAYTVSLRQQLPAGWQMSVNHRYLDSVALPSTSSYRGSLSRTDLRVAKLWHLGARKAEVALVVQNAGGAVLDHRQTFAFPRQAFITLRLQD